MVLFSVRLYLLYQVLSFTTLGEVLKFAGPDFSDSNALASRLDFRSVRLVTQLLGKWQTLLTREELQMLGNYFRGKNSPDSRDPFSPDLVGYWFFPTV